MNYKEFLYFWISGLLGTTLFHLLYVIIYQITTYISISWIISYILSIPIQHYLHSNLVFNNWNTFTHNPIKIYYKSLFNTYISYTISLILSSIISALLEYTQIHYQLAFIISLSITGIINYFTVKQSLTNINN